MSAAHSARGATAVGAGSRRCNQYEPEPRAGRPARRPAAEAAARRAMVRVMSWLSNPTWSPLALVLSPGRVARVSARVKNRVSRSRARLTCRWYGELEVAVTRSDGPHDRLRLTLLGGFQACEPPDRCVVLPTRKTQALLAYLAVPPGRAHSRESLAALLWGDVPQAQARSSVAWPCTLRKSLPSAVTRLSTTARRVRAEMGAVTAT